MKFVYIESRINTKTLNTSEGILLFVNKDKNNNIEFHKTEKDGMKKLFSLSKETLIDILKKYYE